MIRVEDEAQLFSAFRDEDREQVRLPVDLQFPFLIKDYLAWVEPSGHRTYLLYNDRDSQLLGAVFKMVHEPQDAPVKMCQWCHSVRGGGRVSLLSISAGRNRRIGLHLCKDLSCKEKVNAPPKSSDIPEKMQPDEKLARVLNRMGDFLRTNLF